MIKYIIHTMFNSFYTSKSLPSDCMHMHPHSGHIATVHLYKWIVMTTKMTKCDTKVKITVEIIIV